MKQSSLNFVLFTLLATCAQLSATEENLPSTDSSFQENSSKKGWFSTLKDFLNKNDQNPHATKGLGFFAPNSVSVLYDGLAMDQHSPISDLSVSYVANPDINAILSLECKASLSGRRESSIHPKILTSHIGSAIWLQIPVDSYTLIAGSISALAGVTDFDVTSAYTSSSNLINCVSGLVNGSLYFERNFSSARLTSSLSYGKESIVAEGSSVFPGVSFETKGWKGSSTLSYELLEESNWINFSPFIGVEAFSGEQLPFTMLGQDPLSFSQSQSQILTAPIGVHVKMTSPRNETGGCICSNIKVFYSHDLFKKYPECVVKDLHSGSTSVISSYPLGSKSSGISFGLDAASSSVAISLKASCIEHVHQGFSFFFSSSYSFNF